VIDNILTTVLPVFGMIVLGYVLTRSRVFDGSAGRGITLFVFNVAIPALLFKTVATMGPQDGAPWGLWIAFFGGLAITWLATAFVSRFFEGLRASGGAAASMAAGFGNLALLGTPLALAHFGQGVAVPLGMILSIHAPILWTAATIHRELARHAGGLSPGRLARELFLNLAKNGIVLGLLAGAIWRYTGLGLHPVADRMLSMLADASVPTALFALGVSLAGYSLKGAWNSMFALIGLKMVLMPLLVFMLVRHVVELPPLWAKVAVLFAAMPSGANAFLFAQRNDESVPAVSGAITLGTAVAAVSAAVLLSLMDLGAI
jgi:predicted permease